MSTVCVSLAHSCVHRLTMCATDAHIFPWFASESYCKYGAFEMPGRA